MMKKKKTIKKFITILFIINRLKKKKVVLYLVALIKGYVNNITMLCQDGDQQTSKTCTKSCSQESVFGCTFWNVVLNDFLESNITDNIGIIAYADDVALVVKLNTRLELKEKLQRVINTLIIE